MACVVALSIVMASPITGIGSDSGSARAAGMRSLIAPAGLCPGARNVDAPREVQRRAMQCMTNYARRHAGLRPLGGSPHLERSAAGKAADILRCDSFSHYACGRDVTYWMRATGYLPARCWRTAENIGWGTGHKGSVRSIFVAWLRSPGHRQNILGPYRQLGVDYRVGKLSRHRRAHVWSQHLGTRCG